jgi:L-amino acid N-acyltransferase YncA
MPDLHSHPKVAMIRPAHVSDGEALAQIYNHYVANTVVTFEEQPVSGAQMASRIDEVLSASLPWLIAEETGAIAGYAYASKWKVRAADRFSVECSVYLATAAVGPGIGTQLYAALFEKLKALGAHAVMGGVALPNPACVALHEKFGMEKVAQFNEVGFKFGKWIDVAYWQKML